MAIVVDGDDQGDMRLDWMYIPLELLKYRYSTCRLMTGSTASLVQVTFQYDLSQNKKLA